jgi:hypothetical protein
MKKCKRASSSMTPYKEFASVRIASRGRRAPQSINKQDDQKKNAARASGTANDTTHEYAAKSSAQYRPCRASESEHLLRLALVPPASRRHSKSACSERSEVGATLAGWRIAFAASGKMVPAHQSVRGRRRSRTEAPETLLFRERLNASSNLQVYSRLKSCT